MFFKNRWKEEKPINKETSENLFNILHQCIKICQKILGNLYDLQLMKNIIRTRGNLSTPDKDLFTSSIFKRERNSTAKMFIEFMKTIISTGKYSED
jgi:hypothetical protein